MSGFDEVIRKLIGTNGIIGDLLSGRADVSQIFDPLTVPDMGQVEDSIRAIISEVFILHVMGINELFYLCMNHA